MTAKTVLLVEDSEIDQFIAKSLLENMDNVEQVHTAYDGQEALEVLEKLPTPPDFIFLDINMPRMNGYDFLEAYSKKTKQSNVFMLTSSTRDEDKKRCLAYDFVMKYIVKPLEIDFLKTLFA